MELFKNLLYSFNSYEFIDLHIENKYKDSITPGDRSLFYFFSLILIFSRLSSTIYLQINKLDLHFYILFFGYLEVIIFIFILGLFLYTKQSSFLNVVKYISLMFSFIIDIYFVFFLTFYQSDANITVRYIYSFIISNVVLGIFYCDFNLILNTFILIETTVVLHIANLYGKINLSYVIILYCILYVLFFLVNFIKIVNQRKLFYELYTLKDNLIVLQSFFDDSQSMYFKFDENKTYLVNNMALEFIKHNIVNDEYDYKLQKLRFLRRMSEFYEEGIEIADLSKNIFLFF